MGLLINSLNWYQKKIGAYDKQQWEHSIEQRLSNNVNPVPKKTARIKTELIDLDLIRGSAFPKAKPQQSWLMSIYRGFHRVILFPFHYKWWYQQTCSSLALTFLCLYFCQIISLYFYFFIDNPGFSEVPVEEVTIPLGMMFALGIVHSQIVASFSVKHSQSNVSTTSKRRRGKYKYKSKTSAKPLDEININLPPSQSIPKKHAATKKTLPKKNSDEESGLDSLDMGTNQSSTDSIVQAAPIDSADEFFILKTKKKNNPPPVWRRFSDLTIPGLSPTLRRRFSEGGFPIIFSEPETNSSPLSVGGPPKTESPKHKNVPKSVSGGEAFDKQPEINSYATRKVFYSSADSEPDTSVPNTPVKERISDIDWNIITNSDCNSDTSDSQVSHAEPVDLEPKHLFSREYSEILPSVFNPGFPSSDKVSCTVWEKEECQKVDLTVLEISCAIIRQADAVIQNPQYLAIGLMLATSLASLPLVFRFYHHGPSLLNVFMMDPATLAINLLGLFGPNWKVRLVVFISFLSRLVFSSAYFFLLCVAERTFKQRFLYAKHFSHLTSSRRARRSLLPHFRLNKVRNIKTWLSIRSYLKKRGPQRSVDVIVSMTFIVEVCVLSFLCLQFLKETTVFWGSLGCLETMLWNLGLGFFLMRFMTLGSKINKKYRNLSVLITEQINLYLHMEQKPHKKEELMLANNVLKLAADLLKELESPFKISGLCANPYLYNITKVVVLSAFSAVLTELLGFKLKLHNIKIK